MVAKLCKVKVHDFAIGFGPIILKKQKGETLYTIRLIPLGGYVRMEGEEQVSEDERSFSKKSIPQKIAIVLAGASVNIIFGLIVYFALVASSQNYISNEVDEVKDGYGAKVVGILPGDEILEVNGKNIHLKSDLSKALETYSGDGEVEVKVNRNNEILKFNIKPTEEYTKNMGIYFENSPDKLSSEVKAVYPDSSAQKAGIKEKDIIIKVDGEYVYNDPYKVIELTQNSGNDEIVYTISRNGEEITIEVIPEIITKYYLGITFKLADKTLLNSIKYGFWDTIDFSLSIINNLKLLFTGRVMANQLIGPIGISTMVADTNGLMEFIYLLALISLSLGITNLLPIPPLDGWKVVLYLIEFVRRKPMNERLQMNIESLGFAFMIILSIYVAYNDILRIGN